MDSKGYLFDAFGVLTAENPDVEIDILFNHFLQNKTSEEISFIEENFPIFIQSAYAVREAPEEIKNEIKEKGRK